MAILPQERRAVAWSDCGLVQIDLPAHDVPDPSTDNFLLCLVRRGEADSSIRFGERWWHGKLGPDMFTPVTPPDVTGEIRLGAPQRHLIVTIPAARVAAILAHGDIDLGRLHERSFRDPPLARICLSSWDHAASLSRAIRCSKTTGSRHWCPACRDARESSPRDLEAPVHCRTPNGYGSRPISATISTPN